MPAPRAIDYEAALNRWAAGEELPDIAQALGVASPSSIKSIIFRARAGGDVRAAPHDAAPSIVPAPEPLHVTLGIQVRTRW